MAGFRSEGRGGYGGRGRDRDNDRGFGGRSGGRSRFGGRDSRRAPEMHDVTCDECGKECQVPFKPTGDKPVLCSDCFRKKGGDRNGSGVSSEQMSQINAKLDRILKVLQDLEIITEDDEKESEEDSAEVPEDSSEEK